MAKTFPIAVDTSAKHMIPLTRFDRQEVIINADHIVSIESTPDTLVGLTNGDRLHVLEPMDEVVALAIAYQRRVRGPESVLAPVSRKGT